MDFHDLRDAKKTEPVFLVTYIAPKAGEITKSGTLKATLQEAHVDSQTLRNYDGSSTWFDPKAYAGLTVNVYLFNDTENPNHNLVDIEYRDLFSIGADRAERMAKLLRGVEKRLKKMAEELGTPDTTGEKFRRAAVALGVKHMVFDREEIPTRGFSFDDNRHAYLWLQLGDAKDKIGRIVWQHYADHGTNKDAQTKAAA